MLSINDFTRDKSGETFEFEDEFCRIEIDTVCFTIETIAYADQIRQAYPEKVRNIAQQFAAEEDFISICEDATVESIQEQLGKPEFWFLKGVTGVLVNYYNHTFDNIYSLDIWLSGILDEVYDINIEDEV